MLDVMTVKTMRRINDNSLEIRLVGCARKLCKDRLHMKPQLTWETIGDHQDCDRLMSRALVLNKRQVMVDDLAELRTSRSVFA